MTCGTRPPGWACGSSSATSRYLASGAPSDLLISTVPAGVADSYAARIGQAAAAPAAVMDVVYHPWPTPLALTAAAAGSIVASGFAMLAHQAAAQVELMTGKPAPWRRCARHARPSWPAGQRRGARPA